jgi:biopolymer transport protein ExbB/TolQ
MLLTYLLSPFQWSIISFIILQVIAFIKFSVWMATDIQLLKNDMKDNSKRDSETRKDIESIRKEERSNYKEINKRLDLICQALVRVEEKTSHIEKQLDK